MRCLSLIIGFIASMFFAAPAAAVTISFSDVAQQAQADAALGIQVTTTGPNDIPFVQTDWEVQGATAPFLNNSPSSRTYSGVVTFDQPIKRLTLDVARTNNSGWSNPITLTAFDNGKQVSSTTVNLDPLGDWTHVTVTGSAIDKIDWSGSGSAWVFHPYLVRDAQITFADSVGTPKVGGAPGGITPAPEPASIGLGMIAALGALLRRPSRPTAHCKVLQDFSQ